MLRVPLVLPELTVEMNYIGNVAILGYVLFGLVALTSLGLAAWIIWKRTTRVVKGAQPIFLILVLAGVLLMSSAIIPMTIDDEHYSLRACDIACNATPWFISFGFCLTFAALFSKLWRIGRIMQASRSCRRETVTVRDVLTPLVVLLPINLILLSVGQLWPPFVSSEMITTEPICGTVLSRRMDLVSPTNTFRAFLSLLCSRLPT